MSFYGISVEVAGNLFFVAVIPNAHGTVALLQERIFLLVSGTQERVCSSDCLLHLFGNIVALVEVAGAAQAPKVRGPYKKRAQISE